MRFAKLSPELNLHFGPPGDHFQAISPRGEAGLGIFVHELKIISAIEKRKEYSLALPRARFDVDPGLGSRGGEKFASGPEATNAKLFPEKAREDQQGKHDHDSFTAYSHCFNSLASL